MIASERQPAAKQAVAHLIPMASNREIEIKFRVADVRALARKLRGAGFRMVTPRTHEMNTLYDLPGEVLRATQGTAAHPEVRFGVDADA